jgi:putative ABC transport system ATP-binding protein
MSSTSLSAAQPLIRFDKVTRSYGQSEATSVALYPTDLKINRGEFVAIVGPSGSGKSTIMHILGFMDRPSSGKYFFDGVDTSKVTNNQLAEFRSESIGFVFQAFNLLPHLTVLQNVQLPFLYNQRNSVDTFTTAKKVLEQVGLVDKLDKHPNELSGGQMQRVAIARALITQPALLLADEPTGNLDSKTGQEVIQLFKDLHRQGKTIVLITHDEKIAHAAARCITIQDGKLKQQCHSGQI